MGDFVIQLNNSDPVLMLIRLCNSHAYGKIVSVTMEWPK